MTSPRLRRDTVIVLLGIGALIGAFGGYHVATRVLAARPTCANAVDNYIDVLRESLSDRERQFMDGVGGFDRDGRIRTCREGRWSARMKECLVDATTTLEVDACPNEWLNARPICEQLVRTAEALGRRCDVPSGSFDCSRAVGMSPNIADCIEALRDARCDAIEAAKESCVNMMQDAP